MSKTIIALRGHKGCGKTDSIKKFCVLLKREYPEVDFGSIDFDKLEDIPPTAVIAQGVKIGIISGGDYPIDVSRILKELHGDGCEIIVCATRSKGGTVEVVEDYGPEFKIIWIEKDGAGDNSVDPEKINENTAKEILRNVREAIELRKIERVANKIDDSGNPYADIEIGNHEQVRVTYVAGACSGQGGVRIQIRDASGHLQHGSEIPVDMIADVVRSVIRLVKA